MPQSFEERLVHLTRLVRPEFRPQINAALPRQETARRFNVESQAAIN
jgi:hypothetical protein